MGRPAGWIRVYAGIAGGADVISSEIPFDSMRERVIAIANGVGARWSVVVAAEGAHADSVASDRRPCRYGGSPRKTGRHRRTRRDELERRTGKEARHVVLGHLQRGGTPTSYGPSARHPLRQLRRRSASGAASPRHGRPPRADILAVPLAQVVGRTRYVPLDGDVIKTARSVGISLGD
jgi:6-phosphofructokinase 1